MEKAKETGADQELMRSMKVSKAVADMAIPSVISSLVTVVIPFNKMLSDSPISAAIR